MTGVLSCVFTPPGQEGPLRHSGSRASDYHRTGAQGGSPDPSAAGQGLHGVGELALREWASARSQALTQCREQGIFSLIVLKLHQRVHHTLAWPVTKLIYIFFSSVSLSPYIVTLSLLSGFLRVIPRSSACCVIWNDLGGICSTATPYQAS